MQTTGMLLLGVQRCSSIRLHTAAHDGRSARVAVPSCSCDAGPGTFGGRLVMCGDDRVAVGRADLPGTATVSSTPACCRNTAAADAAPISRGHNCSSVLF